MDSPLALPVKRLLLLVSLLVVVACGYILVATLVTAETTGALHVTASDPRASISVGQTSHQAENIGVGKASVRLKPGRYEVVASLGSKHATTQATVRKKHILNVSLDFKDDVQVAVPSVDNIDFEGTDAFLDSGLSADQIDALKQDLFRYKTSARKVNIDQASVQPGPHNPQTSTSFSLNFSLTIDSLPYSATATYVGIEDISLRLYNAQNSSLVFDSAAVANQSGE